LTDRDAAQAAKLHDENYISIVREATRHHPAEQYDSLADFYNRMSAFNPLLFYKMRDAVLETKPPRDQYELMFYRTFTEMLAEAEMLILSKKIRKDSGGDASAFENKNKTKEELDKEKDELEKALNDDSLC
jgi:hypothetical protein